MIIVKLGGSLSKSDTLINCIDKINKKYAHKSVVIVPGGGAFADQVRLAQQRWQFNDTTAHKMAILAMQQMALLIQGLNSHFSIAHSLCELPKQLLKHPVVVWSPDIIELDNAAIPASWDISSDSLAAWLANTLSAKELILVKSALIDNSLNLKQLAELNIIDQGFCTFVEQATFNVKIINHQDF